MNYRICHANNLINKEDGLTKREYFAAMAMQGLLSGFHPESQLGSAPYNNPHLCAEWAVASADALIEALNRK